VLKAAFGDNPDNPISEMKYKLQTAESFSVEGTFKVSGELRKFKAVWDNYHRLISFVQGKYSCGN
ncbi:hypothetical protein LCGC14_1427060, partial [marine sediment metagenome]